jgi:hypothetical protein
VWLNSGLIKPPNQALDCVKTQFFRNAPQQNQ